MTMFFVNSENKGASFIVSNLGWYRIYNLAQMYGWSPMGTQFDEEDWDTRIYLENFGQSVTAEDASGLGNAIQAAIPDLKEGQPEEDAEAQSLSAWEFEFIARAAYAKITGIKDPAWFFLDTTWSTKLVELAAFCQRGSFKIY
jgi:hypothetical protein